MIYCQDYVGYTVRCTVAERALKKMFRMANVKCRYFFFEIVYMSESDLGTLLDDVNHVRIQFSLLTKARQVSCLYKQFYKPIGMRVTRNGFYLEFL